jgi:hypothetical protein
MSDSDDEDPRLGPIVEAVHAAVKGLPSRPVSLDELARHRFRPRAPLRLLPRPRTSDPALLARRTATDLWVNIAGHIFDVSPQLCPVVPTYQHSCPAELACSAVCALTAGAGLRRFRA